MKVKKTKPANASNDVNVSDAGQTAAIKANKDIALLSVEKLKKKMRRRNNIEAWILLIPTVFILYTMVWRPTVMAFWWSFFKIEGFTPTDEFVGLNNFKIVVTNSYFVPILLNTCKFVMWSMIIGYIPPLLIAAGLNEMVHFRSGLRLLIYLPVVIPGIAAMLIWTKMYDPGEIGLLNMALSWLDIAPYDWLMDPDFTIIGIVIYMTWKGFGGSMLLYFASMQGISTELYEAALIDGAGPFKRFWYVTRPAIEGLLILNFVRQIIGVFQVMQEPFAMTDGGPNFASTTLSLQLYRYGFLSAGRVGQAMALGVIIFLILIVFTIFYFWLNKKVESRY
ncbi:MAG: sugar ABC transporter permease [Ruminococcaceae bacterium]|nr:sugar ABC transporter permease [Oscillospiraceae bacterium]